MGILDAENNLKNNIAEKTLKVEKIYAKSLFCQGGVKCVIDEDNTNWFLEKIAKTYNKNFNTKTSLHEKIELVIKNAWFDELKEHLSRPIISLDCRPLRKGDAAGWMRLLAAVADNQIVVLNYVTQIPDGERTIFDDPIFVENLLVRSWKNEDVYFEDLHIDRRKMTIILACPKEDEDKLRNICASCSYSWWGNFDVMQKAFDDYIDDYTKNETDPIVY